MPDWEKVKESFGKSQQEAAEELEQYLGGSSLSKGHTLYIATLTYKAGYPTVIRLKDLPQQVRKSGKLYESLRRVIR